MTLLEALVGKTWKTRLGIQYVVNNAFIYLDGKNGILIHTTFGKDKDWPVPMGSDIEHEKAQQDIWTPDDVEIAWSDDKGFHIKETTVGGKVLTDV